MSYPDNAYANDTVFGVTGSWGSGFYASSASVSFRPGVSPGAAAPYNFSEENMQNIVIAIQAAIQAEADAKEEEATEVTFSATTYTYTASDVVDPPV